MPDDSKPLSLFQIVLGIGGLGGLMYLIYSSDDDEEGVSGGLEDYYNPEDYTFDSEKDAIKAKRIVIRHASKHGVNTDPIIQEVDEGTFLLLFDEDEPWDYGTQEEREKNLDELVPLFSQREAAQDNEFYWKKDATEAVNDSEELMANPHMKEVFIDRVVERCIKNPNYDFYGGNYACIKDAIAYLEKQEMEKLGPDILRRRREEAQDDMDLHSQYMSQKEYDYHFGSEAAEEEEDTE